MISRLLAISALMLGTIRVGNGPIGPFPRLIAAESKPLDLDGNGRYEWLRLRFRIPDLRPGSYVLNGSVDLQAADSTLIHDEVFPKDWDWSAGNPPQMAFRCQGADCRGEVWVSGRWIGKTTPNGTMTVHLDLEQSGSDDPYVAQEHEYIIRITRKDWWKFEWGQIR